MTKRTRRDKRRAQAVSSQPASTSSRPLIPSAQTMFRTRLLASTAHDLLSEAIGKIKPKILERDQGNIDRIEQAETAEEVLDLAVIATGISDRAWYRRMQAFGPKVAPLITERLKDARDMPDRETRTVIYEHLLSALGFYGEAGIEAVLACFDALSDYGKSLACVVLGHLGAQDSANRLWDFYQSVKEDIDEDYFIGPLWGLVDLEDPRAADALDELLWSERFFYESFAMAYKAGDARVVMPLMYVFYQGEGGLKDSAIWALTSVAHRIGWEALLAEIRHIGAATGVSLERHQALADRIFILPQRAADEYFAVFYQGLAPSDVDLEDIGVELDALERIKSLIDEGELSGPMPPPPEQRPGRNDPCWCGSGKKYKYCHWRQDRAQGL